MRDKKIKKAPPILKLVPITGLPHKEDNEQDGNNQIPENRPGLQNPFVQQMRAYADRIDQEIKSILDL